MALPSGLLTFLFTDIEGSTRLWESHPETMATVLRRHDALLAGAIEVEGGIVVKHRGEGDSFFAVFDRPQAAVFAACRLQAALAGEQWPSETPIRVRAALHTGEAELRDGDYYGPAINRCARIRALGHGGQTLLSQATYDLAREAMPAGAEIVDLGEHRLRDLARPERIFQVVPAGLPATFPPLKSIDSHPNNLPLQMTSFIGREHELVDVKEAVTGSRLVTLVGPGGSGKTRIALQVASDLLESFADGAWFVDLAPLTDAAMIGAVLAAAIGIREEGNRPIIDTLLENLKDFQALFVFDNCEHLVSGVALVVETLLRRLQGLRFLATSREALAVGGERVIRIQSMGLPPSGKEAAFDEIAVSDSVRLFVERGQLVSPSFSLAPGQADLVADICRDLDGIPLAIELAAARLKVLSLQQIRGRLGDRFRLLTGGSAAALPRQQTLRATIDWSYDLLFEDEKMLLRRLAVFAGGFTLEAAEQICSVGNDLPDVLDLVTRLVDRSLVSVMQEEEGIRFRLLETIREYATEKLQASDEGDAIGDRHLAWFRSLAEATEPRFLGPEREEALALLIREQDNLRAALNWSRSGPARAEAGLALVGCLFWFWRMNQNWQEGRVWAESVLANPDAAAETNARKRALACAGGLAFVLEDHEAATARLEESIALGKHLGDMTGLALPFQLLGMVNIGRGNYEDARRLCQEAAEIARESGSKAELAISVFALGDATAPADIEKARDFYMESCALWREVGDSWGLALPLTSLIHLHVQLGEYDAAAAILEETEALRRQVGDRYMLSLTLNQRAEVARFRGDLSGARSLLDEALSLARDVSRKPEIARSLFELGMVALLSGNVTEARQRLTESATLFAELEDVAGLATTAAALARVAVASGNHGMAAELGSAAGMALARVGGSLWPVDAEALAQALAAVHSVLGEVEFGAAVESGRQSDMYQTIKRFAETAV